MTVPSIGSRTRDRWRTTSEATGLSYPPASWRSTLPGWGRGPARSSWCFLSCTTLSPPSCTSAVSFSLSFKVTLGIFFLEDALEDVLAISLDVVLHVFEPVDDRVDDGDIVDANIAEVDVCRALVDDSVLVCWYCVLLVVESGNREVREEKELKVRRFFVPS